MDAVSIALRILGRLLFYRPLIAVLLMLVYLVTALLLATIEPDKRGIIIGIMGGFQAGGLAALLTERIRRFSFTAGQLGLPDHARIMRLAQAWFLVLLMMSPAIVATLLGMQPLRAVAILGMATAAGIVLATYGGWWLILVPLIGRSMPLSDWLALPAVQAVAVAASAWVIWRWFRLPRSAERTGGISPSLLADAAHERASLSEDPAGLLSAAAQSGQTPNSSAAAPRLQINLETGRSLPSVLALGFGYSVAIAWRAVLYGIGVAALVLLAWHASHGRRPEALGYIIVTAACCLALVGRMQGVLQRLTRTSMEQSLLRLSPQWPEARQIKQAIVQTTFLVQRGSIAVWAVTSIFAALLGWMDKRYLIAGGVAVAGTSFAFSGALFAVLARRRIREWHLSTIAEVILVSAGALAVVFVGSLPNLHALYGVVLMVVPPALALCWYAMAPLRLPLDVDPRAVQPFER